MKMEKGRLTFGPPTVEVNNAIIKLIGYMQKLECIGRNSKINEMMLMDTIKQAPKFRLASPQDSIFIGSSAEGIPERYVADFNSNLIEFQFPMVVEKCDFEHFFTAFWSTGRIIYRPQEDNPAYINLEIAMEDTFDFDAGSLAVCDQSCYGRLNLSSSKFLKFYLTRRPDKKRLKADAPYFYEKRHPKIKFVPSFNCLIWPSKIREEFENRQRPSGWLSQELLDQVTNTRCQVVPAGRPGSATCDHEWRMSFGHAVNLLMNALPENLFLAYFLLKKMKMQLWDKTAKVGLFKSYHLKTACLWVAEQMTIRTSTDIITICERILDYLINSYSTHELKDYFISKQNLINHLHCGACDKVKKWLAETRTTIWQKCFSVTPENLNNHTDDSCDVREWIGIKLRITNYTDSRILLSILCTRKEAIEVLKDMIYMIKPEGNLYKKCYRYVQKNSLNMESHIPRAIVAGKAGLSYIKGHPKLEPITTMKNIERYTFEHLTDMGVLTPGSEDMYKKAFQRHLGDLYLGMYMKSELLDTVKERRECLKRAEEYYTRGLKITLEDGSSDDALTGLVLLARLFYMADKQTKLARIIYQLESLLHDALDPVIQPLGDSCAPITASSEDMLLSFDTWKNDTQLKTSLQILYDNGVSSVEFHPVAVGLYIWCRAAIRYKWNKVNSEEIYGKLRRFVQSGELTEKMRPHSMILVKVLEEILMPPNWYFDDEEKVLYGWGSSRDFQII